MFGGKPLSESPPVLDILRNTLPCWRTTTLKVRNDFNPVTNARSRGKQEGVAVQLQKEGPRGGETGILSAKYIFKIINVYL